MYRKIKNPDDWKACPFCGHKELEREPSTGDIACNVCAYTFYDTSEDNSWWNSRPIEDTLRAENEKLKLQNDDLLRRIIELSKKLGDVKND